MEDPVTIESGRTFDRSSLVKFFGLLKAEGKPCFCPATMMLGDPEIQIANVNLKADVESFYEKNPWSFEFDPR